MSDDGRVLGNGTVVAIDDLLAEITYRPNGTDRLQIGDRARPTAPIDEATAAEPAPPPLEEFVAPDPVAGLDLILRIFRSR